MTEALMCNNILITRVIIVNFIHLENMVYRNLHVLNLVDIAS